MLSASVMHLRGLRFESVKMVRLQSGVRPERIRVKVRAKARVRVRALS